MKPEFIIKRDGRTVPYDDNKIADAIMSAFVDAGSAKGREEAERLARLVTREVARDESIDVPTVEGVQDTVERVLIGEGYARTAKAYILYRAERSRAREAKTRLQI